VLTKTVPTELVGVLEQLQERTVHQEVILDTTVQYLGQEVIDLNLLLEQRRLEHLLIVIREVVLAAEEVITLVVAAALEVVEPLEVLVAEVLEVAVALEVLVEVRAVVEA
jgi:hypothetical protein